MVGMACGILPLLGAVASSPPPPPFAFGNLTVTLNSEQTVQSIIVGGFEMAPNSSANVPQRLGDVSLRVRPVGTSGYATLSTNHLKVTPITPLPPGELAAASIALSDKTLGLERHYAAAADGKGIRFWFTLTNNGSEAVEVGAWSTAMMFKDMGVHYPGKVSLDTMAATDSFIDPAISGQHGFVSVTRCTGEGAVLLVVPENGTDFQAYPNEFPAQLMSLSKAYAENEWINASGPQWLEPTSLILSPGGSHTFAYRLLAADSLRTKDDALAAAGFAVLQAVPSYSIATDMESALLHVLPPRGRTITGTAVEPAGAVAIGEPGAPFSNGFYALPVRGKVPGRARVTITYSDGTQHVASYYVLTPLNEHVQKYGSFLSETAWYGNLSDPFSRGHSVLAWNRQLKQHIGVGPWDNGYEDNRIFNNGLSDEAGAGTHVGLGAVAGGSVQPSVAAKLDLYINDTLYGIKPGLPFGASLQCVEGREGDESPSCGPPDSKGPTADGVMASMFWVPTGNETHMPGYDYDSRWFCEKDCPPGWPGWRWDQSRGASLGRAYNYAHVSSSYLGMYQAAVYDKLTTIKPRVWYLTRAYKTIVAMAYQASWYSHQGLMDGTNFWTILIALEDEGMAEEAAVVRGIMENRTMKGVHNQCRFYACEPDDLSAECVVARNTTHGIIDHGNDRPGCHWYLKENVTTPWVKQTGLPGAGSEFAWDTTGQEEAYIWGVYFNATALAQSALNQILAYTPLVPNWAYHGSALGSGDFGNNGWLSRSNERVLQHYRSGLNSIPSTEAFLRDPSDLYLLRLAAGSISGVLTNIDEDGAPAMAFHGDPKFMTWDPASGDHGLAFYGHSHNTQSFLVKHSVFGLLCYFCDLQTGSEVVIVPRDSYRRTVYIAELGLQVRSDAGTLAKVAVDIDKRSVTVFFDAVGSQPLSAFRFRVLCRSAALCANGVDTYKPTNPALKKTRGGYVIKPADPAQPTPVTISG